MTPRLDEIRERVGEGNHVSTADTAYLLTEIERLRGALEEMRTYASHAALCRFTLDLIAGDPNTFAGLGPEAARGQCSCGFDAALAALDGLVRTAPSRYVVLEDLNDPSDRRDVIHSRPRREAKS